MSADIETKYGACSGCGCPLIMENGVLQHDYNNYRRTGPRCWVKRHIHVGPVPFFCCKQCGSMGDFASADGQLRCDKCGSMSVLQTKDAAIAFWIARYRNDMKDAAQLRVNLDQALADEKATSHAWYNKYYKERKRHWTTVWFMTACILFILAMSIYFILSK